MIKFKLFLIVITAMVSFCIASGQDGSDNERQIPVYPGSELNTESEPGDRSACCTFKSSDNFEKVVSFYENALKLKSVTPAEFATRFPDMKGQIDMVLKEMPAGSKLKIFILKNVEFQGMKGAETFAVAYTTDGRTEFTISDSQLSEKDMHYAEEWEGMESESGGDRMPLSKAKLEVLAAALPAAGPAGYEKSELNLNEFDYSAGVDFSKPNVNINITVYDQAAFGEDAGENIKVQQDNEKAVTVKGKYPGKEKLTKLGNNCGGADKIFLVKNKYLVVISTMNMCDFEVINQLIDKMNLDKLP